MNLDDQIRQKLKNIMEIIATADDYISKLEQFSRVLTDQEKNLFDKYPLLDIIRLSFWDIAILELCKLFNQKERFSLYKILNNVIINYSNIQWKYCVEKTEFVDYIEQIDKRKYLINRLKSIRNHFIAHYDNNKTIDSLTISELRELLELAQKIYNKIELGINDSQMTWDSKNDTIDIKMIKNLSKFEQIREFIVREDFKGTKSIQTADLIKVLMQLD